MGAFNVACTGWTLFFASVCAECPLRMQALTELRALSLSQNPMGKSGLRALASTLTQSQAPVEELHLSSTRSTGGGGISEALTMFASGPAALADTLRVLDLSHSGIDNSGCEQLSVWLKCCMNLEVLDLSYSAFEKSGAGKLKDALRTRGLRALRCGHNDIGNQGVRNVLEAVAAQAATLELLDLEASGMTGNAVPALVDQMQHCSALRVLNIGNNSLTDQGIALLAPALKRATALEELYVHATGLQYRGMCDLVPTVQAMPRLKLLNVRSMAPGYGGNMLINVLKRHRPEMEVMDC